MAKRKGPKTLRGLESKAVLDDGRRSIRKLLWGSPPKKKKRL